MIAKMSTSNTLYAALSYNQMKVNEQQAKVIFTNKMIETVDGIYNINTCLQSFEPYLLANQRTEKPVLHISINPDPKDKLNDEQLSEIAQAYMQKMGFGQQPFIVYKHEDIDRHHLHIVSVCVDEQGKKINDKFEHRRSMTACRELEQEYGLIPADQRQRQEGLPLKPIQYDEGDVKHQIANVIRPIAKDYHFLSLKEYKALLSKYNVGMEEVRGEVNGKEYKGIVYFALNEKGEKVGHPFKSSLFGKSVGIDALEKRIEKSAEIINNKELKERSKKVITAAMCTTNNRADFEKALERQGMSVLFRENEQGRIYGATFIDHEQKCVFNGSHLGREFSANVFNDMFSVNEHRPKQPNTIRPSDTQMFEPIQQSGRESGENTNFGGIFDLFFPGSTIGDDIAEKDLIRRSKKKKKKKQKHL